MAYLPLSTANLPDPVIDPAQGASPEDYFNTVLYNGTGSTQTISGVGFQPDFIWVKSRNNAGHNILLNVLSGNSLQLKSNTTDAETAYFNQEFESDGFSTTASDTNINGSGYTYVAWNWKANGSGVSNTDGNVTSTVSANTTSGFSVVTWTGDESVSDQVGHGLNQKPDVIIARRRDAAHDWIVWGEAIGTAYNSRIFLNRTDAIGTTGSVGASTDAYFAYDVGGGESWLAYCFHSVEGFSKFGSYVGNGSTDGPFIYTGFKPKWFLWKRVDGSSGWSVYDAERDPYNYRYKILYPDGADAEGTPSAYYIDFVSNGIKIRGNGTAYNTSGSSVIYMAFAENPFKYSTAS
jgi:hypothetical protein